MQWRAPIFYTFICIAICDPNSGLALTETVIYICASVLATGIKNKIALREPVPANSFFIVTTGETVMALCFADNNKRLKRACKTPCRTWLNAVYASGSRRNGIIDGFTLTFTLCHASLG